MSKFKVDGIVADYKTDKWISKTAIYEASSEAEALKKFRYDYKVKDGVAPKITLVNSCSMNAKFKVGDKVVYKGDKGTIKEVGGNGNCFVWFDDGATEWIHPTNLKASNSCASSNPVVQNALKACNAGWAMISREGGKWYYAWADGSSNGTEGPFRSEDEATIAAKQDGFKIKNSTVANADEYVVRKSLSTSKWLLSKKAKSLSGGEDKVFGSEQEARDFAKKNGLKVVNSEVVENEDHPMKRCRQDLTKAQEYLILAKQSIRPTMHDNAQEWFYEIDGIAKEVSDLRKRIVD